jgi:hypothetical protein
MLEFGLTLLGVGGGYLLRHAIGERRWRQVRDFAANLLGGGEAKDERDAVNQAILRIEFERLGEEAEKLKRANEEWSRQLGGSP